MKKSKQGEKWTRAKVKKKDQSEIELFRGHTNKKNNM